MSKIGILGAGHVGVTLGKRFASLGYTVVYGVRDPSSVKSHRVAQHHPGKFALVVGPELVFQCEIIFLAIGGKESIVHEAIVSLGGKDALADKIIVDVTNPIDEKDFELIIPKGSTSNGEYIQALVPDANVVKAFNTVGREVMARANEYKTIRPVLPVAANNAVARSVVKNLAEELGFRPLDMGSIKKAKYMESMAMMWISLGNGIDAEHLGRTFAFGICPHS
jgi:predicted dinucleotide-binding enzyme